ncbi:MAG: type transport system permease protein, partial [Frankiaceae bacterium]|nr:type transport system permease protein [Frankiaceae bacterium]
RGTLRRQLGAELRLVFRRRRNLFMLLVLTGVPVLIGIAVRVSAPRAGEGPPLIGQLTGNGLFLAFAALTACLPVFLPLAVAVVAGDAIAGEAHSGTLRYLLTLPVSRTRLLFIKAFGVVAYVAAAVALIAAVGIALGVGLFGAHGMTLLSGDTVSLANGALRALGVAAFVVVDLLGLAAVAMFFSTLTEVPIGAMAATVGIAIAFAVLDAIPQLAGFRGLLLTHHWFDFGELLRRSVDLRTLLGALGVPVAYTAIFGAAAWARLTSADVTS